MLANVRSSTPFRYAFSPQGLANGVVTACLAWAFWPVLAILWRTWGSDPQYSHGYLVPLFSLYLLWSRWPKEEPFAPRFSWWGVALLLVGLASSLAGTYLYSRWLRCMGLLPCIAGVWVFCCGVRSLRWSWPALAFLVFMMPLLGYLEVALAKPLQRLATVVSTYALQTLGFTAISQENVIRMGQVQIGVVTACSGLSMLLIFVALATAVVLVTDRPLLDRALILLSAVPIAVLANIIRITVTGVLHKTVGSELADMVFHDLAGWLMMPLALILLWTELKLLSWVLVESADRGAPLPWMAQSVQKTLSPRPL